MATARFSVLLKSKGKQVQLRNRRIQLVNLHYYLPGSGKPESYVCN